MRIGLLHDRVRTEEKLLIEEIRSRSDIELELIDFRQSVFNLHDAEDWTRLDAIFERGVSQSRAATALLILESFGVSCVNSSSVALICGDKMRTSMALERAGVRTPRVKVAVTPEAALEAIESMGYPVVLKPPVGSWGRLLCKINDRHAAEAILEHKATLGGFQHSIFYIQEYIDKPGRDLRGFVIGDQTIAGICRHSPHWITNSARGGAVEAIEMTDEFTDLCQRAAKAVGGGILAVDVIECPQRGLLVNEINYTMEFRNSIKPTGVNIPARMVDFLQAVARGEQQLALPSGIPVFLPPTSPAAPAGGQA